MSQLRKHLASRSKAYICEPEDQFSLRPKPADKAAHPLHVIESPYKLDEAPIQHCAMLPMAVHNLLSRHYIPSKDFFQDYQDTEETLVWVGVDLDLLYMEVRTQEEFIGCVYEAFQDQQFYITEYPPESPCVDRGFWMQIRGYFPGPGAEAMADAAKRHVLLLDKLITAGYVSLQHIQ